MKNRFNTYDIICGVTELQKLVGLRVNQIYDIDNKTYLIRFQQNETKIVLLLESGIRFHTTAFEWPKNVAPSGFSMKLRKHLKNKRLEKLEQLGDDRIVDFQFGVGEASYHIILELYDRGNIILTDHDLTILNILRPHVENEEIRFAVREKYPVDRAKIYNTLTENDITELLKKAQPGDNFRRILTPLLKCGPTVIDHVLLKYKLNNCIVAGEEPEPEETVDQQNKQRKKKKRGDKSGATRTFDLEKDFQSLLNAIKEANNFTVEARNAISKGFIFQNKEIKPSSNKSEKQEYFYHNIDYQPFQFEQYEDQPFKEFDNFMACVDEFYSTLEGQKIDMKTLHQERDALKKLQNVKTDHIKRLENLTKVQEIDKQKAELISRNQAAVDNAILAIRSAIANQMSWPNIHDLVKTAQANKDPVACLIKQLKLETNHIALTLMDPYRQTPTEDDNKEEMDDDSIPTMIVDIDLGLSAWANARKYYDQKRSAAKKEQKTIDASEKALKSAERKTQQTLKEVRNISTISKARKMYWFEKFYWFISSENFLVIGGRDAQQNELIVKRYMRPADIYVHAEIQGASSVIIRNPTGNEVPPKTLLEAGTMAISYSVAWDAKVVTNAYWVKSEQVTKTAPTGEYLGTGSFMVRGKKNFLPPCHLIMGLSILFKLEDGSVARHKGERRVRLFDESQSISELTIENEKLESVDEDDEIALNDSEDENDLVDNTDDTKIEEKDEEEPAESETENDSNDDNDDNDNELKFPDTQIKIEHDTGRVLVENETISRPINKDHSTVKQNSDVETTIIAASAPRKKQQTNSKKKKAEKQRKADEEKNRVEEKICQSQYQSCMKRGQKGKLKKIKSKYKDQDDEERELRMQILKSAGTDKQKSNQKEQTVIDVSNKQYENKKQFQQKLNPAEDDLDDTPANADVDMLDTLTGSPVDEDEILFAIPFIGPYQSIQNYKFKIKLTPGTGKRGRAAKNSLMMFAKEKNCTLREKDLLKSIKEEALARNIPGKVKLSAPQLHKYKK